MAFPPIRRAAITARAARGVSATDRNGGYHLPVQIAGPRSIGPVFLDALPAQIRRNVPRMLEFFPAYLQSGQSKPSSLGQLAALGARPLPDQRESLRASVIYWAAQHGFGPAQTEKAA